MDKDGDLPVGKPELGKCWKWLGNFIYSRGRKHRYGRMKVAGRTKRAHVYSWELHNNAVHDSKLHMMHFCNNTECTNPDHLQPGTAGDNAKQRVKDGRESYRRGQCAHTAKLTNAQAVQIREEANTIPQNELAKKYGVADSVISNIVNFKTYYDVDNPKAGD